MAFEIVISNRAAARMPVMHGLVENGRMCSAWHQRTHSPFTTENRTCIAHSNGRTGQSDAWRGCVVRIRAANTGSGRRCAIIPFEMTRKNEERKKEKRRRRDKKKTVRPNCTHELHAAHRICHPCNCFDYCRRTANVGKKHMPTCAA